MPRNATFVLLALAVLSGPACSTSTSAKNDDSTQRTNHSAGANAAEEDDSSEASKGTANTAESSGGLQSLAENLPNGARPFENIVTAGQPSEEQFRRLGDTAIQTVVNFRSYEEEGARRGKELARELGLNYVHIPITQPRDLNRKNVEEFADVLASKEGKFLVHCGSSNRVGAMFALRAYWVQDKNREEAMQIGMRAGLSSLREAVQQKMNAEQPAE